MNFVSFSGNFNVKCAVNNWIYFIKNCVYTVRCSINISFHKLTTLISHNSLASSYLAQNLLTVDLSLSQD